MKKSHTSKSKPGAFNETKEPLPRSGANPLSQAQRAVLDDFVEEMNDTVIPEIIKVVEERRALATHSRLWSLKTGG